MAGVAPLDVQLDKDDKTMLQPDVYVVCNRDKFKKNINAVYSFHSFSHKLLHKAINSALLSSSEYGSTVFPVLCK